jgi:spermidine/putrescine transport system ATP-binding protein
MTVADRVLVMHDGRIEQSGTPTDVYEHPVNRFVAGFLGLANLIPATRRDDHVETPFGPLTVQKQPPWTQGTLAIRPECIRLSPDRPDTNPVRAIIRELIYRGDHIDLFLDPGPLRVRVGPHVRVAVGQPVWLELPPHHLEVLAD